MLRWWRGADRAVEGVAAVSMGVGSGRSIPALTVRMARASNPRGTPAMWVRDRLDELFVDDDFADWFPADGRRGLSPARLAMVSVLQYAENLTDRQAAEAVRCRLDWKYCLAMDLDDPGFDFSVLSEFRDRMARGDRADRLLVVMVDHLAPPPALRARGLGRTRDLRLQPPADGRPQPVRDIPPRDQRHNAVPQHQPRHQPKPFFRGK
ncbi:transposase [Streptomyces cupreus]|uniref:transposase n=1 Tax=Streptomyces cupreus TaxID=2759956 RepID=UPI001C928357